MDPDSDSDPDPDLEADPKLKRLRAILSAAMYCSYIKSDFGTCAVHLASTFYPHPFTPRILGVRKMEKLANDVITIPETSSTQLSAF